MIVLTYSVPGSAPFECLTPRLPIGVAFSDLTSTHASAGKPVLVECDDADAAKFDAGYYIIMGNTDLSAVPPQADVDAFIALVESWGVFISPADRTTVSGMTRAAALEYAKTIMRGL